MPSLTSPSVPVAVSLEHVSKRYTMYPDYKQLACDVLGLYKLGIKKRPDFPIKTALNDISFSISPGERVALVGRNGAGKSTLLKLLTGNFVPSSGRIYVNGSVQALIQVGLGFHPHMTGLQNIKHALIYSGFDGAEHDDALEDIIDFCELGEFLHQPFSLYSLGMQARTQFAVSTALRPDILIVDEVLGAGDGYFSHKSLKRLQNLTTKTDCTLLLVSHSAQQVLQFCDRAIRLDKGQVVDDGDASAIMRGYEEEIFNELGRLSGGPRKNATEKADVESEEETSLAESGEQGADIGPPPESQTTSFAYFQYLKKDAPFPDAKMTELYTPFPGVRWDIIGNTRITFFRLRNESRTGGACLHGDTVCCSLCLAAAHPTSVIVEIRATSLSSLISVSSRSEPIQVSAEKERAVSCRFPLVLGSGDFVVSAYVLQAENGRMEDALSGLAFFSLTRANHSDPPVLFHPGTWSTSEDLTPQACRISPYV